MHALLALAPVNSWGLAEWFIAVIVLAAVVGITKLSMQYFGIEVPDILWKIVAIVVVAAFAIIAIRFLLSL